MSGQKVVVYLVLGVTKYWVRSGKPKSESNDINHLKIKDGSIPIFKIWHKIC